MIQEKDFLYRVPVKTAPITTPGGQIRNPEILVDLEGGEFMHGNILDANSTSKLVNQSVKEAVDNKLIESGYVTKDLLDAETTRATEQENNLKTLIGAETSARTKGDEDLSSKIKAEQTRAEGKEKEISDKLAIVNGDSNTEGSFRKAIADVVAAAPEDLDTLKEIADKLAGNDDLHTALNQAITEKADASALANEVSRATGVESGLQAAIATKADATALSNYVLTTALNKQVDTLNAAISAKQDAGNYLPYRHEGRGLYYFPYGAALRFEKNASTPDLAMVRPGAIQVTSYDTTNTTISIGGNEDYYIKGIKLYTNGNDRVSLNDRSLTIFDGSGSDVYETAKLNADGIKLHGGDDNHVLTSNASTIDITEYAKKTDIPEVDTSDFVSKTATDAQSIESELSAFGGLNVAYRSQDNYRTTIRGNRINIQGYGETTSLLSNSYLNFRNNEGTSLLALDGENGEITISNSALMISKRGIFIPGSDKNHVLTAGNSTIDITQYVLKSVYDEKIAALEARIAALEAKHPEATA